MKAGRTLYFCGLLALPQLAMADVANADGLAAVHAILTYCAQADPKDAAAYQAVLKSFDAAEAQGDSDYKKAYDSALGQLAGMSRQDAARVCASFVPAASKTSGTNGAGKDDSKGGSGR